MKARISTIVPVVVRQGSLRHRVTLKRPATAADGLDSRGQVSGSDVTLISNWPCEVTTLSGAELDQARQSYPTASHVIRGRYLSDRTITVEHYASWNGRRLNIGHIRDVGNRRMFVELLCGEAVDA